ncbi:hypothetical protein QT972_11325 [Microcoleus sp. herbarium7]
MIGILAVARSPASTSGDAESSIEIPHHRVAGVNFQLLSGILSWGDRPRSNCRSSVSLRKAASLPLADPPFG